MANKILIFFVAVVILIIILPIIVTFNTPEQVIEKREKAKSFFEYVDVILYSIMEWSGSKVSPSNPILGFFVIIGILALIFAQIKYRIFNRII